MTFRTNDWKWIEQQCCLWLLDKPVSIDPVDLWEHLGLPLSADSQDYAEAREQVVTVLEDLGFVWCRCPGTSICYMTFGGKA